MTKNKSNFFLLKWFILLLLVNFGIFSSIKIDQNENVKEYLKNFLLKKLDVKEEPTTLGDTSVPAYLLEVFETNSVISNRILLTNNSNTLRNHQLDEPDRFYEVKKNKSSFLIKFNINLPKKEYLNGAELRIFIDNTKRNCHLKKQRIVINEILQGLVNFSDYKNQFLNSEVEDNLIFRQIDTITIEQNQIKWLHFDILPAVERWFDNNEDNKGLLIKSFCFENKDSYENNFVDNLVLHPKNLNLFKKKIKETNYSESLWKKQVKSFKWKNVKPILLTYSKFQDLEYDIEHLDLMNKTKRHILSNGKPAAKNVFESFGSKNDENKDCSRYSMYVDFKEIGWEDWILAPRGYDAFFCYGDCSLSFVRNTNTTNHATIQSLSNGIQPDNIPPPCCVPTGFTSITMIYKDRNTSVLKIYEDMIVTNCGCR